MEQTSELDCKEIASIKDAPQKHHIELLHYRQKSNWDCGVSCVLMVLPNKHRQHLTKNLSKICKSEGFNKSTWTIDLCYLLKKYEVQHVFYTVTIGVHEGYRGNSFYHQILTKDENRVKVKFRDASKNKIPVRKASISILHIIEQLLNGPIIILTNARLLYCDICKSNKISNELRKCLPWPTTYQGHYIVLCGYDIERQRVFYRNPSFGDRKYASNEESQRELLKKGGFCRCMCHVGVHFGRSA
uniref:Protein GUCD1 n=1 Tax=Dendroctonus ponderosae TaxID=77166 RepID=A0AAR5PSI0_DENPD